MKKWLEKHIGISWKTTLAGYFLAAFVAVQPLLTDTIDWTNKHERLRYIFRLLGASAIAVFGKYCADSHQVKEIQDQADTNSALIDQHLIECKPLAKKIPAKKIVPVKKKTR